MQAHAPQIKEREQKMKKFSARRCFALLLALTLCAGLLVGCAKEEGEVEEQTNVVIAQSGGDSVPFTEEFDTSQRFGTQVVGDTLCVAFNGIQNNRRYKVPYFTAASDTLTVTGAATAESERNKTYRVTLWKRVDGGMEYVGSDDRPGTIELTADGSAYTAQFTGLEPGAQYKVGLAYDGRGKYFISGQLAVRGLAGAEAAE